MRDDVISRQAAMDFAGSMEMCDEISVEAYQKLMNYLEELPSAQPELTDEDMKLIKQLRSYHNGSYAKVIDKLLAVASAQPDNRLSKIAELVEGTIDHFDLDDAMDLLYQIKEVLK